MGERHLVPLSAGAGSFREQVQQRILDFGCDKSRSGVVSLAAHCSPVK
jgi:hypothetical protein